ncbi:hypothetical protein KAT63_01560 [Candidatus Parcubacteria bacterium]|nr:hypothetical protein [Candidatus Parcubacteria bacterium]
MNVIVFPSITVITKKIFSTEGEKREHKKEQTEALKAIRSQVLHKDLIGILEIKRYCKEMAKTTEWAMFVISPDADDRGPIFQRISELLSDCGGHGSFLVAGMHIIEAGEESLKLKEIFENSI